MATLRKRSNGHWQARVRKANQSITKTFINKADAERWAKQTEVELDKGSFVNLGLAERTTFAEIIERYIAEVLPTMRGGKADYIRLKALARRPIAKPNHPEQNCSALSHHLKVRQSVSFTAEEAQAQKQKKVKSTFEPHTGSMVKKL